VPGTEGKLAVLEWRATNGYALWHRDDVQGHAPITTAGPIHPPAREPRVYRIAVAG
jgi:hypothetical protein